MVACRSYRKKELPTIVQQSIQTGMAQLVGREMGGARAEAVAGQIYRMYEQALAVPRSTILVVDWPPDAVGEGPAAYTLLMPQPNPFTAEGEVVVMDIFTSPSLRGRGVGKSLLQQAEQYARSIKAGGLVAQVAVHNQASMKMCLLSGFQPERVTLGKRC